MKKEANFKISAVSNKLKQYPNLQLANAGGVRKD